MKDELIDRINRKAERNRMFMAFYAFPLAGFNSLLTTLFAHFKHPEVNNDAHNADQKFFLEL